MSKDIQKKLLDEEAKDTNDQEQKENKEIKETEKEEKTEKKEEKKSKIKVICVSIFIAIFVLITFIIYRRSYLEYKELGYIEIFNTNIKYSILTFIGLFLVVFSSIYFINKGIKKGIKPFFEDEKKTMPKLPNKSIAFVSACILAFVGTLFIKNDVMVAINSTSFGKTDSIFHLDYSYYVFQRPLITIGLKALIGYTIATTLYMVLYYIVLFNKYFDGIDKQMLAKSKLLVSLKNAFIVLGIIFAIYSLCSIQEILFGSIVKTKDDYALVGAGAIDTTIRLYGTIIFAIIILFSTIKSANNIKTTQIKKILTPLFVIPAYLVCLFVFMFVYDIIFIKPKLLDKQAKYIEQNITNTRESYSIKLNETNLDYSGTITKEEVLANLETINNIPIVNSQQVQKALQDTQSEKGYYTYNSAVLEQYEIDNQFKLMYVCPRVVKSSGRTYQNKTYEYTHGMGLILVSATQTLEDGRIKYIQKEIDGTDSIIQTTIPQTYFANDVNDTIATKTKNKQEYDYTDDLGNDITSTYEGTARLSLNIFDRLVLAIKKLEPGILFNSEMTKDSKLLINRNIITRAKKLLPDLIYDSNCYPVIDSSGSIKYVIDCYTYTSYIPYSQYTTIEKNNRKLKINYINNSIKVIVDSYNGDMKFYVTNREDPIAMAYYNMYPTLFVDKEEQIPEDISQHLTYPKYLYDIQANMLNIYHSTKSNIVYRADDLWEIAKSGVAKNSSTIEAKYTYVAPNGSKPYLGLVQLYTPQDKKNVISYLIGSIKDGQNQLELYTFKDDSNVIGPAALELQLSTDEEIKTQLEALNVTGTKQTSNFVSVPIGNSIVYVKPIFQNFLNEKDTPILKKVIVASGNKVAIGDNLDEAIDNLVSTGALGITIVNSESANELIEAIINANNNLTQSANDNNYELFGKDLAKLQELIKRLEDLQNEEKDKEDKKQEQDDDDEDDEVEEKEDILTDELIQDSLVS